MSQSSSCCVNTKRNSTSMEDSSIIMDPIANSPSRDNDDNDSAASIGSPRSVVTLVSPPTKRQKHQVTHGSTSTSTTPKRLHFGSSKSSILDWISDDSLTALIFSFAGPKGTARCAQVCPTWKAISRSHPSLWRTFCATDFKFHQQQDHQRSQPWCSVYSYLKRAQLSTTRARRVEARVVFADDGGNFPGYPAQHALTDNYNLVWCTSTGADANVDLVLELQEPCLLTGFVAANGGRGYSAPLKEGLVFVSMDPPPSLHPTTCFNIAAGDDGNCLGRRWVRHLNQPKQSTRTTTATAAAARVAAQEEGDDAEGLPAGAPVLPLAAAAAAEESSNDTNPGNNKPKQQPPPVTPHDAPHPVAAFYFADLATAYHGKSQQTLAQPMVGRYIHFKLLSSHSPPGLEHISDNIDLMSFVPVGIPLDPKALGLPPLQQQQPTIPNYPRQHAIRPSRIAAHPLDHQDDDNDDPAWLEVEFF